MSINNELIKRAVLDMQRGRAVHIDRHPAGIHRIPLQLQFPHNLQIIRHRIAQIHISIDFQHAFHVKVIWPDRICKAFFPGIPHQIIRPVPYPHPAADIQAALGRERSDTNRTFTVKAVDRCRSRRKGPRDPCCAER